MPFRSAAVVGQRAERSACGSPPRPFLGIRQWKAAALLGFLTIFSISTVAQAAEVTNYSYDALGRLKQVKVTSGPRNGSKADYVLDPAGNRTSVTKVAKTQRVVVVPINGLTVILLPGE